MTAPDNIGEMYGKLTERLHIAGYTFERASANLEWLLEGERWKLGGRFADVNKFIDSLRLGKFKQLTEQRQRIVARIKELHSRPSATGKSRGRWEFTSAPSIVMAEIRQPERNYLGTAIDEIRMVTDANAVVIRTGELTSALLTALASAMAISPAAHRSPAAMRKFLDELHRRLPSNIARFAAVASRFDGRRLSNVRRA